MEERKAKAEALRRFIKLLLELANVEDYNSVLLETVDAWERETEYQIVINAYLRCNDTARTKQRAIQLLQESGFSKNREKQLLRELGYAV